jgi:hypothetical protein
MTTIKNAKKCHIFTCEKCAFECSKESNYKSHLETIKHKRLHETTEKMPNNINKTFNCICGNKYNHHTSLAKHKRTCIVLNSLKKYSENNDTNHDNNIENKDINYIINDIEDSDNKIIITKYMFMELINDNKEMMKIIKEQQQQINTIIPKICNTNNNITNNNTTNNNTTNNNFNLNVFLNDKCKDALNISDFIDSLKITLEDLLFSKTNGISRGITDVMIKGLKELDIYKRPIHCTDIKRDIMYIKDEDKWQKDDNHKIIKNTIVKIADKERNALQEWAINNPDWIETEEKQIEYLTMMKSICEPIENYNNYERKIIKNLEKEIQIDKKN